MRHTPAPTNPAARALRPIGFWRRLRDAKSHIYFACSAVPLPRASGNLTRFPPCQGGLLNNQAARVYARKTPVSNLTDARTHTPPARAMAICFASPFDFPGSLVYVRYRKS